MDEEGFLKELGRRESIIRDYLRKRLETKPLPPPRHIHDLSLAYIKRKGKRLRPAVLLFACGAAGGKEELALSAAAGVELAHTWTLTHDDVIDHDETRRGKPTVHVLASERARHELLYDRGESSEYGERIAILVGDAQHAWSVTLFLETPSPPVNSSVVIEIVHLLESQVIPKLIDGETLDIQFEKVDIERLSKGQIVEMLRLKTGVLYEFAAVAGAMLGLNCPDRDHPLVRKLASFASECGTAFQLQDDILGIVGNEEELGKPVGSDIREGKRTTVLQYSLAKASPSERRKLLAIVGNHSATKGEIREVIRILSQPGYGVDYTKNLARERINDALPILEEIPPSKYRDLLAAWADFMIDRRF